jgi:hypothetical protein
VTTAPGYGSDRIDERFGGPTLDPAVWVASYLPAWSSYAEAAATYELTPSGLRLSIPSEQGLWCPDRHSPPLRVSAVQTGNWSGPVGSTQGQAPFAEGLTVREQQPASWGYTPHLGRLEVELSARIGPRSMFSAWLIGLEDDQRRCGEPTALAGVQGGRPPCCGEICLVEVFGDTLTDGGARVGCGIKAIRDPALTQEFSADWRRIDVSQPHVYAVDWRAGRVDYFLDGEPIRTTSQAPDYPMQLILGVFDFPDPADPIGTDGEVPELVVHRVTGHR